MKVSVDERTAWPCPLLKRTIEAGHCVDINYQRLGYFSPDVLLDAKKETSLSEAKISEICEACPNYPLEEKACKGEH